MYISILGVRNMKRERQQCRGFSESKEGFGECPFTVSEMFLEKNQNDKLKGLALHT